MNVEYSKYSRDGFVYAYSFTEWEKKQIVKGLKPAIKKIEKQILKIQDDPNNEGQATYCNQIYELRREIESLELIINTFTS